MFLHQHLPDLKAVYHLLVKPHPPIVVLIPAGCLSSQTCHAICPGIGPDLLHFLPVRIPLLLLQVHHNLATRLWGMLLPENNCEEYWHALQIVSAPSLYQMAPTYAEMHFPNPALLTVVWCTHWLLPSAANW